MKSKTSIREIEKSIKLHEEMEKMATEAINKLVLFKKNGWQRRNPALYKKMIWNAKRALTTLEASRECLNIFLKNLSKQEDLS